MRQISSRATPFAVAFVTVGVLASAQSQSLRSGQSGRKFGLRTSRRITSLLLEPISER
jgi:hypothetical protein